jgi:carbonic anhydrase
VADEIIVGIMGRKIFMNNMMRIVGLFAIGFVLVGCSEQVAPKVYVPAMSAAQQREMTPNEAIARLQDGNMRFSTGESLKRYYVDQVQQTAAGQYPFAVVLSCMDSRSGPELVFDQGLGDLFVLRVAGNYATADMLGSMEYATKVSGAKVIVVLGHTECGAIKGACDNVDMGNLTTVIQALRPAVDDVKDVAGDRTSKNKKFVQAVAEANVRRTVAHIRKDSQILHDLEQSGQIKIVGAMYDISTGQVKFFNWDAGGAG